MTRDPRCSIWLSGSMHPLIVTETFEQVMASIDEARERHDNAPELYAAPLVRVTSWVPGGFGPQPAAFAPHAVVTVCAVPEPQPRVPEVPDHPPDWLSQTARDDDETGQA